MQCFRCDVPLLRHTDCQEARDGEGNGGQSIKISAEVSMRVLMVIGRLEQKVYIATAADKVFLLLPPTIK